MNIGGPAFSPMEIAKDTAQPEWIAVNEPLPEPASIALQALASWFWKHSEPEAPAEEPLVPGTWQTATETLTVTRYALPGAYRNPTKEEK